MSLLEMELSRKFQQFDDRLYRLEALVELIAMNTVHEKVWWDPNLTGHVQQFEVRTCVSDTEVRRTKKIDILVHRSIVEKVHALRNKLMEIQTQELIAEEERARREREPK